VDAEIVSKTSGAAKDDDDDDDNNNSGGTSGISVSAFVSLKSILISFKGNVLREAMCTSFDSISLFSISGGSFRCNFGVACVKSSSGIFDSLFSGWDCSFSCFGGSCSKFLTG
jgi:hypothetical protein